MNWYVQETFCNSEQNYILQMKRAGFQKRGAEQRELCLSPYSCDTCRLLCHCEPVTCSLGKLCAAAQSTRIRSHLTHFHTQKQGDGRRWRCSSSTFRPDEYADGRQLKGERTLGLCRRSGTWAWLPAQLCVSSQDGSFIDLRDV